jgi:hypothetical protein
MLKLGIYKKEQLTLRNLGSYHEMEFNILHLYEFFKSRKCIALDLYNSLDDLPLADSDKIQGRMLGRFALDNGSLKYTHSQRYDEFDQFALKFIKTNFTSPLSLRVHDIGASDGRTSCDFFDDLSKLYDERIDLLASDYAPYLYILKRSDSTRRIILDERDNILQIVTPPFVFIVVRPESKKVYPVNHVIQYLATIFCVRPLMRDYKSGRPGMERNRLDLLSRKCREYVSRKKNFHFECYDMLKGPNGSFDVIRAMNVLNHSYFSREDLKKAIANISGSLNEGGLLITGSNFEAGTLVSGGIYKKVGTHLELLGASGKGSKVDNLIRGIGAPAIDSDVLVNSSVAA